MQPLTKPQRAQLKKLAHHLEPVVYVGKQGVTDTVVQSADQALTAQELIKVRFVDLKEYKKELAAELESRTQSALVTLIGHVAILYRQHPEEEKRKIILK